MDDQHQIFEFKKKFAGISDKALIQEILKYGIRKSFAEGEIIVDAGQYIKSIPLVWKGFLKISRIHEDKEILLYYLKEGETCSMCVQSCQSDQPSSISAVAMENTELLLIPDQYVSLWIQQFPNWSQFLIQGYHNRFDDLIEVVDKIAFQRLDERIIDYLKQQATLIPENTIIITHQKIASDLGTSREVISRLLKKLEKMNYVQLSKNKIVINEECDFDHFKVH
ncbi:MAG: Crp/Fnr family transcriptional regulator [Flavobacteriales bacterium]|nr:Crp/Fnr family transcriptional regulator [Flavobacteriales bacterium]